MGNTCQDFMPVSFLVLNVDLIADFFASKSLYRGYIFPQEYWTRDILPLLQIKVVRNISVKGVSYYEESLVAISKL